MQEEQRLDGGSVRTRRGSVEADNSLMEPLSRGRRRVGIILMAIAGCAAVLAVASSDEENRTMRNRGDALLSTSSGTSQVDVTSVIKSAGMQSVMQELLAVVEGKNHGDGQTISWNEGGQPVELEQAAAASTAPCDASVRNTSAMCALF